MPRLPDLAPRASQIMATEATFNEASMRATLELLTAIEAHMQLPPGAIDRFSRLLEQCTALRAREAAAAEQATAGQDLTLADLRFPGPPRCLLRPPALFLSMPWAARHLRPQFRPPRCTRLHRSQLYRSLLR